MADTIQIQGKEYGFVFDNACIRDLGREYKHETVNETLELLNTTINKVGTMKGEQSLPYDVLDFLEVLFWIGLNAANDGLDLKRRDVYNELMNGPELLGKGLLMVVEAFSVKEQKEAEGPKKK